MAGEIALPPADDVVGVLMSQHDRVRALLAELHETVAAVADITADMAEPFGELVRLLVAHEAAEELVVYPTLRRELEEGRLVEARTAEEHEAKQQLARVEKLGEGFFAFPAALAELEALVLAHAEQEEQTVFPRLVQGLPADERLRLAADVHYAAARAPSHAHAHSPESSVGNAVLGPVLATIDRVRDAWEDHLPSHKH
jgi:hemerythrin superfamily protein